MSITKLILYISTAAWIFPIFRQLRSNLFYFFLVLGLCDPISILLFYTIKFPPGLIGMIISPILFFTLNIDRKKTFNINILDILVFILTAISFLVFQNYDIVQLIINIPILFRLLYKIIIPLHKKQTINFFYLVLAFYFITSTASLIIFLNGDNQSVIFSRINLAFEVLIAIFFSIFREDDKRLIRKILPVEAE